MFLIIINCIYFVTRTYVTNAKSPKYVIVQMADDMCFNDVSFRGNTEIPTLNIDAID